MLDFIAKLQKKPEGVRRKIALALASGITLCIIVLWLLSLTASAPAMSVSSASAAPVREEDAQGIFKESVGMIREAVRAIQEQLTGTLSIYPEKPTSESGDRAAK